MSAVPQSQAGLTHSCKNCHRTIRLSAVVVGNENIPKGELLPDRILITYGAFKKHTPKQRFIQKFTYCRWKLLCPLCIVNENKSAKMFCEDSNNEILNPYNAAPFARWCSIYNNLSVMRGIGPGQYSTGVKSVFRKTNPAPHRGKGDYVNFDVSPFNHDDPPEPFYNMPYQRGQYEAQQAANPNDVAAATATEAASTSTSEAKAPDSVNREKESRVYSEKEIEAVVSWMEVHKPEVVTNTSLVSYMKEHDIAEYMHSKKLQKRTPKSYAEIWTGTTGIRNCKHRYVKEDDGLIERIKTVVKIIDEKTKENYNYSNNGQQIIETMALNKHKKRTITHNTFLNGVNNASAYKKAKIDSIMYLGESIRSSGKRDDGSEKNEYSEKLVELEEFVFDHEEIFAEQEFEIVLDAIGSNKVRMGRVWQSLSKNGKQDSQKIKLLVAVAKSIEKKANK